MVGNYNIRLLIGSHHTGKLIGSARKTDCMYKKELKLVDERGTSY